MPTKIEKKIVGYQVESSTNPQRAEAPAAQVERTDRADIIHMHESVKRPEMLIGSTYKVKTPSDISEHSLYITINDIILNEGTEHELRRPFEVFINSKNMEHFQWIVALTRIISAVFRKGGDVTFLVEELRSVFDPRGGYWKRGGKYMPSLVAEIGDVIERHLISIGLMKAPELDEHQKQLMDAKREEFSLSPSPTSDDAGEDENNFPSNAELCKKCHTKAVVVLDNCATCLNCGNSKCG